MPERIKLTDLLPIEHPERYKLHLAAANEDDIHPLDEYLKHRSQ